MAIRVMLAEDHRMVREVIVRALKEQSDIEVVGEASSGVETLAAIEEKIPDVLLLDIGLPGIDGIEVASQVTKRHPTVRILALSAHSERPYIEEMLKAGARGYVVKSAGVSDLVSAIRVVMSGGCYVSPEASQVIVRNMLGDDGTEAPPGVLGKRERQVLGLVAGGKRSAEIAVCLDITLATVEVHRRNIMRKLNLHSTADLTRYAIHVGLIPSSPELGTPLRNRNRAAGKGNSAEGTYRTR